MPQAAQAAKRAGKYAKAAKVCQADRTDYQTYLLRLVEQELLDREGRARERRIKAAGFPGIKTLDSFDFAAQPSINQQLVCELLRGEYIEQRENVLLIGNSGTGTLRTFRSAFAHCSHHRTRLTSALWSKHLSVGR